MWDPRERVMGRLCFFSIHLLRQVVGMASTSNQTLTSFQNLKEEAESELVGGRGLSKPLIVTTRIFPATTGHC